jgi:succinoglycan biosynthesis transport protein ExoP
VIDQPVHEPVSAPFPSATGTVLPRASEQLVEPKHGFDFRHLWQLVIERMWMVALCVLIGILLALGYLGRTPKLYQGHVVLEVDFQEPTVIEGEQSALRMRSMFLASQEALRTIEQNFTNRSLLARVVRTEGLAEDGGRGLLGQSIQSKKQSVSSPHSTLARAGYAIENLNTGPSFTPLEEALGGALSGMVKPVIRRGTRLIDLYVTNRDPAMAQRLAEAIGREYIRNSIERRAVFSQDSLRYLLEEEERLKAKLQRSEAAVADYKAKTPDALQLGGGAAATGSQTGASSSGGRSGLLEDKLQELSSKLTAAKSDRIRLEEELRQIEDVGENVDKLLAVPSIAVAPTVSEQRRNLAQLEASVAALAQRYKEKHPKMVAGQAALAEARDGLRRAVLGQPAVLRNTLEQARAAESSLQIATGEQEKAALALNKAAIGYQELARQAETDRALYESVLRQIKETDLTKDVKTNAVSIIEHSLFPRAPISPSPTKAILLGLLAGLAAGLTLIFGVDALDYSIKTVDQAEATLGLPVLAAIPEAKTEAKSTDPKRMTGPLLQYTLVAGIPDGPAAEAFRNLRAALSLLGPEMERKVTLFASAMPNEGKSFTCTNYALSLAQLGHSVLLVDGDLRRPSMHKIFQLPATKRISSELSADVPGIVDCLVGETNLESSARPIPPEQIDAAGDNIAFRGKTLFATRGQLFVLGSGRRAPNPAELLSGPSFGRLMAEAVKLFDRVVIDSAPVLAVSDTLLMAPHVQTVCMVLRAGKTPRSAVQRAISLLVSSGIRPAGVVLNRLPHSRGTGHYYYYASHGYGAGEGPYSDGHSRRSKSARRENGVGAGVV